jgi:RNA polymerase sigma-70 factor (ECF subfamily)
MSFRPSPDHEPFISNKNDSVSSEPKRKESLVPPGFENLTDEELAAELVNGTHDALTILFERHSDLVFSICNRILRDQGEAEETLQQIFLDVFRAIGQFDPNKANFKTWLLQFAYHRTFNRKRHLESKGFYSREELDEAVLGAQVYAESSQRLLQMFSSELVHLVEQLLGTIEIRQRRVIELTFFDGMTAEEIATQTGETANVVRHNLYRGLSKLRLALLEKRQAGQEREVKELEGIFFAQPRRL